MDDNDGDNIAGLPRRELRWPRQQRRGNANDDCCAGVCGSHWDPGDPAPRDQGTKGPRTKAPADQGTPDRGTTTAPPGGPRGQEQQRRGGTPGRATRTTDNSQHKIYSDGGGDDGRRRRKNGGGGERQRAHPQWARAGQCSGGDSPGRCHPHSIEGGPEAKRQATKSAKFLPRIHLVCCFGAVLLLSHCLLGLEILFQLFLL